VKGEIEEKSWTTENHDLPIRDPRKGKGKPYGRGKKHNKIVARVE